MVENYNYLDQIALWLAGEISNYQFDEYNLNGARLSGKTVAFDEILAKIIAIAIMYNKRVAVYVFRKYSADALQLRKDFQQSLDQFGFTESTSKVSIKNGHYVVHQKSGRHTYKFAGGSFVEMAGVYKSSGNMIALKGNARCQGYDLSIIWREEANEFDNSEKQAIEFSIRGAKRNIVFSSSNPDLIFQDHISYCNKNAPFKREILESNGEQITTIIQANIRKLFHYTNYKVNKHLEPWQIAKLEELKEIDPVKYEVWGLGMPGGIETSIFARYMKSKERDFNPISYSGGVDLGQADSPVGHPTVAMLVGFDLEGKKCAPLSEYFHSNATMQHKDSHKLAEDIIRFYIDLAQQYPAIRQGLEVFVDYGAGGLTMIDIMKRIRQERYPLDDWLTFYPVDKSVWFTKDRVDATIVMLTTNQLQISQYRTPKLFEQMNLMEWKQPSKTSQNYKLEMLDKNDDCWDSLMYAIMHKVRGMLSKVDNPFLLNKKLYNSIK